MKRGKKYLRQFTPCMREDHVLRNEEGVIEPHRFGWPYEGKTEALVHGA